MIPTFNTKDQYLSEIWIELTDNVLSLHELGLKDTKHQFTMVTNYVNYLRSQPFDAVKEAYQELVHCGAIRIV